MKRFFALLLACFLLLTSFACGTTDQPTQETAVEPAQTTAAPAATPEPTPAPTPEPTPDPNELFREIDVAFASAYLSDNLAYSAQMVEDASALGIALTHDSENAWGVISHEADKAWIDTCAAFSAQLAELNYDGLTDANQVAVDTMQRYFASVAESAAYPYAYEPLDPESGVQASIELMLSLFAIEEEADIETYFRLIGDVPAFFAQVLTYEQERFAEGYHMTTAENKQLVKSLSGTAKSGKKHFLVTAFADKLAALGLDEAAEETYKEQHLLLIEDTYCPAFETLYKGMEKLRPKYDTQLTAACDSKIEGATDYYLYQLRQSAGLDLAPYEAAEKLSKWIKQLTSDSQLALFMPYLEDDEDAPLFETESTDASLSYLKAFTEEHLAALPEHTLTVTVPDKSISKNFAAAYVFPALDAYQDNTILLPNEQDGKQLILLAHETYPGHLYQTVYQRSLGTLSISQQLLTPTAYSEAWSQFAEYFVAANTDRIAPSSALLLHRSDMYAIMTGAYTSILVNYYGLDEKELTKQFGSDYAAYYDLALSDPYALFPYAFGYIAFMEQFGKAQEALGDAFDAAAYTKAYLDLGPGYMDDLTERMDAWVDANTPAAAVYVPDPAVNAAFEQFDEDFYRFYVTQNAVVYLKYAQNNPRCTVDITEVDWSLGHYNEEAWNAWHDALADFHARLKTIDRSALDEQYRFAYDTLDNYFANAELERGYYGYVDLPNSDAFTVRELMETIIRYPMETAEDVELYFKLLEDVPRMCEDLGAYFLYQRGSGRYEAFSYTRERNVTLGNAVNQFDNSDFQYYPDNFRAQFAAVFAEDSAKAESAMERLENIRETVLLPALQSLNSSAMKVGSGKGSPATDTKYYRNNAEALEYYAWRIKQQTGLSVDDYAERLLQNADLYAMLVTDHAVWINGAADGYRQSEQAEAELSSIAEFYLPAVEDVSLTETDADTLWFDYPTTVDVRQMLHLNFKVSDKDLFTMLLGRHRYSDGYRYSEAKGSLDNAVLSSYTLTPGLGYLYSYLDESHATLSQSVLMPASYDLGWAKSARTIAARHATSQDSAYLSSCMYYDQLYSTVEQASLLGTVYYMPYEKHGKIGEQLSALYGMPKLSLSTLASYGRFPFVGEQAQSAVYTELFTAVQLEQGDDFDEKAFHTYYLSLGPSYPHLIREAVAAHYGITLD